jgi:small subunit ribosomal protein S7
MTAGKKTHAEKIVLDFLTKLNQACQGKPNIVFHEVIEALRPSLTIVVRRIGRRYYQVPVPIITLRQYTVALNWLLNVVKANPRNRAAEVLCDEFVSTYFLKKSEALRQKEQLYQTVIKNRAFNHYRWV